MVFGDNANLSISVARTAAGADAPGARRRPEDPPSPTPSNASSTISGRATPTCTTPGGHVQLRLGRQPRPVPRLRDEHGSWRKGYMDFLGNEFRGPASFVVVRFGLPTDALENSASRSNRTGSPRGPTPTSWPPGTARPSRPWGWASAWANWRSRAGRRSWERGRRRTGLFRPQPPPWLPLRIVYRRRPSIHRRRWASRRSR